MKPTLLLAACLASPPAFAEFLSGNDLLSLINSSERHERSIADGFIMGVHDTGRGALHCSPTAVTLTQLRDLTSQFITASVASRHRTADSLVSVVLGQAFPCPKRQSKGGDA